MQILLTSYIKKAASRYNLEIYLAPVNDCDNIL